jgi:hypothetical protein
MGLQRGQSNNKIVAIGPAHYRLEDLCRNEKKYQTHYSETRKKWLHSHMLAGQLFKERGR